MESIQKKSRIVWVDVLRGFLILTVVLGHTFQRGDYNNSTLWNLIYSFHMSAFFVLSGWIGYKPAPMSRGGLLHRAASLLGPFFVWTIVKMFVSASPGDYLHHLLMDIMHPDRTYWFLYVLFVVVLIMEFYKYLAIKCSLNELLVVITCELLIFGVMALFEVRVFGLQFIAFYSFFYALGYLLRKYNVNFSLAKTLLIGLCWLVLAMYWRMHDVPAPLMFLKGYVPASLLSYAYRVVTAAMGSVFFLNIARIFFQTRNIKFLSFLGVISLEIYIIHLAFGGVSVYVIDKLGMDYGSAVYNISDFILRVVISVLIIALIERIPMAKRLLFFK